MATHLMISERWWCRMWIITKFRGWTPVHRPLCSKPRQTFIQTSYALKWQFIGLIFCHWQLTLYCMNNESSDGKIWNLQWWHKMASETHWYFFHNFLMAFFKDIKLLQKCNCMQKPQKHGSRAPLQICNSMRFPAESGLQIHCENATACTALQSTINLQIRNSMQFPVWWILRSVFAQLAIGRIYFMNLWHIITLSLTHFLAILYPTA